LESFAYDPLGLAMGVNVGLLGTVVRTRFEVLLAETLVRTYSIPCVNSTLVSMFKQRQALSLVQNPRLPFA
jgi:hypothetical protein